MLSLHSFGSLESHLPDPFQATKSRLLSLHEPPRESQSDDVQSKIYSQRDILIGECSATAESQYELNAGRELRHHPKLFNYKLGVQHNSHNFGIISYSPRPEHTARKCDVSAMSNNTTTIGFAHRSMHLQLNSSAPDSIGFARVSGFYCPGAWTGWFLTLCTSWYSLLIHGTGFDANTCLYLAGTNWSSFDLLRHLHALSMLRNSSDEAWIQEAASVGAAYNVLTWGLVHALAQMVLCYRPLYDGMRWDETQRGLTLIFGTTFPATALAASVWLMDGFSDTLVASPHIPALYFDGMPNRMEMQRVGKSSFSVGHDLAMVLPGTMGICTLIIYSYLFWRKFRHTEEATILGHKLDSSFPPSLRLKGKRLLFFGRRMLR